MTDLHRSARIMTLVTIASRLSGFLRIAVFANVFGRALLANTYQLANTVPNILFELFAAGALQAVLVPAMVRLTPDRSDVASDAEAEQVAGTVLSVLCGGLAVLAAVAMLLAPQIMGALTSGEVRPDIRQAETDLGVLFLLFFMPQLVFYGANVVATAVLNARGWFALPVFAPLLNNIVVIIAYLWFGARHDGEFSLVLSTADLLILAGGTTLGVVVFCTLPIIGTFASGFRLRPHFAVRHPAVRALASEGAWAGLFLAVSQVTQLVILWMLNREPGGPSAYQYAFVLFTLPHALFAVPIMTTRFPAMSRSAQGRRWDEYRSTVALAVRSITFMGLISAAAMVAVAQPAVRVVTLGKGAELAAQIAGAAIAFAPGIVGYGLFLFFTRALYTLGDQRTPALVNVALVAATVGVMLVVVTRLKSDALVAGLAATFGVGHVFAAAALGVVVLRRLHRDGAGPLGVWPSIGRSLGAAVLAGGIGFGATAAIGWTSRGIATVAATVGLVVVAAVYLLAQWATGGPAPRVAVRTLGAGE